MVDMTADLWEMYWSKAAEEAATRSPEFDHADYYVSGRKSKAWPDKETPDWWADHGPKFVKSWEHWRDNCGLEIASFDQVDRESGELTNIPAIELECWAYGPKLMDRDGIEMPGTQLIVRSFIDRVFEDPDGNLYIVDLKTGSHTPAWPQQLALNALCLKYDYGETAVYGGFWKAREGGVPKWHDLTIYTDEWLWDQVYKAKQIRDQQLFVAQPTNLCTSACGVSKFCVAMGGKVPLEFLDSSTYGATMTHNNTEEDGSECAI